MSAHFQYDRKFRIYITLVVLLIHVWKLAFVRLFAVIRVARNA